uniref:MGC53587 protein n=1 Tax=Xenopus laevis TaxID=8355 RepID=Q08B08_XENLA|nr:MGC53587 protein [Xenopus laevis]
MKCIVVLLVGISIGWVHSCSPPPGAINVARSGEAKQSSTYAPRYIAQAANDGSRATNLITGPCSSTAKDNPAWWQVDLKKVYKVNTVVIVNRGDCCRERLLKAQIRIGNSPNNENPMCSMITDITNLIITMCCNGMEGRYVSVVIPGRAEELNICEVEVYGEEVKPAEVNLARLGEATQSSIYRPEYHAAAAIDGNRNANMMLGSCSLTGGDNPAWWRLDLKKTYNVDKVVIVNRGDCCGDRLRGAQVLIGNSADNNNPVCGAIINAQSTITLSCNKMVGRYVSVVIPGRTENLQLCEVEVYGQEVPANVARLGEATQSSLYRPEYNAAAAIDGNKATNVMLGSCSHTGGDNPAWWKLDLKKMYKVQSVVIVNRGDCCSERLKGAEIRVGNSADNNNPVCGTITDVSKNPITLPCNWMVGRYVSVVIPGRVEYLHICEVEVIGLEN